MAARFAMSGTSRTSRHGRRTPGSTEPRGPAISSGGNQVLGQEHELALEDDRTIPTRPGEAVRSAPVERAPRALLFDLDGVITDTAAVQRLPLEGAVR